MKGIVIYKSKYGATRLYAQWIAARTGLAIRTIDTVSMELLRKAEVVILGSSVYIGKLLIRSWIRKHANVLKDKQLFIFVVCGTPVSDGEKIGAIVAKNLPGELIKKLQVFFLPGSLHPEKLSLLDKLLLRMGARLEKDPGQKKRMRCGYDEVKQENVSSLVQVVGQLMEPELNESPE
jgi:menaquinone-dependent protoporphyrinogen IX oxidase